MSPSRATGRRRARWSPLYLMMRELPHVSHIGCCPWPRSLDVRWVVRGGIPTARNIVIWPAARRGEMYCSQTRPTIARWGISIWCGQQNLETRVRQCAVGRRARATHGHGGLRVRARLETRCSFARRPPSARILLSLAITPAVFSISSSLSHLRVASK